MNNKEFFDRLWKIFYEAMFEYKYKADPKDQSHYKILKIFSENEALRAENEKLKRKLEEVCIAGCLHCLEEIETILQPKPDEEES